MNLTLRSKLLAGFGTLIAVSVVSGAFVIHNARLVKQKADFVLSETMPVTMRLTDLRGQIHHALSMHRGYMILGLPALNAERIETWQHINEALDSIERISQTWPSDRAQAVKELDTVLAEFRAAQDRIAEVANTPSDRPADVLYYSQALPEADMVVTELEAILAEEASLEATPERKRLVQQVTEAKGHLLRASAAVSAYLVSGTDTDKALISTRVTACAASVAHLKGSVALFTPTQAARFDQYLLHRQKYLDLVAQAVSIRSSPGWCVSEDICLNTVTPLADRADELAATILAEHEAASSAAGANAQQQLNSAVAVLPPIVLGSIVLSAAMAVGVAGPPRHHHPTLDPGSRGTGPCHLPQRPHG